MNEVINNAALSNDRWHNRTMLVRSKHFTALSLWSPVSGSLLVRDLLGLSPADGQQLRDRRSPRMLCGRSIRPQFLQAYRTCMAATGRMRDRAKWGKIESAIDNIFGGGGVVTHTPIGP